MDSSSLSRKTVRSPEGNVDVEPPSSIDDSSMILIEIGVDVDEGPRPNMVIRTRGTILGRTKVTIRTGDEDAKVAVDLQASHRSFCRSHSGTLNESTNVGVKTGGFRVGGSRTVRLGRMVTGGKEHDVLPGSGPLDGGKTLRPA